jgi:hypothetical protein
MAFDGCTGLTSVTIPDSVTTIEDIAFGACTGLTTVTIPNSVNTVGELAFAGCTGLTSVIFGSSVTTVGDAAFSNCTGLTGITIPASVISIGDRAFQYCTSLTRVYFRGGAPSAGAEVFREAANVTVYYLPGSTGWGPAFAERLTALWVPVIPNLPSSTGIAPLRLITRSPAPATLRVQWSFDLLTWDNLQTVSRDGGPSEVSDADASGAPCRFYRGVEE